MKNLLRETMATLKSFGKTEKDVLWVGSRDVKTTWENFKERADIEYDSGYGDQEVVQDLVIVGSDWWLTRGEYDGSEWWGFNSKPDEPKMSKEIISFVNRGYSWSNLINIPANK